VFLFWFIPISSRYQTSRQKQKGRDFGGEVRGPPLRHTGKNDVCSLSVTWMLSASQELHIHEVLTCFVHLLLPSWEFRHLLVVVSLYKPWIRGPVRSHPRSYEFATDLWIMTPHLLCSQAMSHSHTFTCRHPRFPPHFQCLEVNVLLLLKDTWVSPGGDQATFLPLRGRPNIWTGVLTSVTCGAPLTGSCTSPVSIMHARPSPDRLGGEVPPPDQTIPWCLVGSLLSLVWGMHLGNKRGEKPPTWNPRNVVGFWNRDMRHWGSSQKAMYYCANTESVDLCPKAELLEQKGLTLGTLISRLQKQDARFNP
jgi:hypothetical protein